MAGDEIIRAEGLGKKYLIGHQVERERYVALRDVLAGGAKNVIRFVGGLGRTGSTRRSQAVEEFWALRDINFAVQRGEVVGIIGHNGAGKSTLLKILSRITEPSEGRVSVKGRVASLLEVGTGFHPELTGRENIYLNGAILGMGRAEIRRKFDEIVSFAEVEKFLDTPVKRYSSGMYVRLAFAVAAHLEPEILIVDEVLAVGDAEFQKKCLGKMSEVSGGGRSVLFVSHNLGALAHLCPRSILLKNGRIVGQGATAGIIAAYLKPSPLSEANISPRSNGNPIRLVDASILQEGYPTATILWSKPFSIDFQYECPAASRFDVAFSIFDIAGRKIFYSDTGHCSDEQSYDHYTANVTVPARLLAPGSYSITAALHQPNVAIYDRAPDMLHFTVIADDPKHYRFAGADIGVVTVDLPWSIAGQVQ